MTILRRKIYERIFVTAFFVTWVTHLLAQPAPAIYTTWEPGFTHALQHTHDMALPAWGPLATGKTLT